MGFDEELIDSSVERIKEDRIERLGGIQAASEKFRDFNYDGNRLREQLEESLYASLWREWRQGIGPGSSPHQPARSHPPGSLRSGGPGWF